MMRLVAAAAAALSVASASMSSLIGDPSYVVQIHSTREAFTPLADERRTQLMTTATGQRFECFLPLSPLQQQARAAADALSSAKEETNAEDAFLSFARAAVKRVRPMCVQYVDVVDKWVYEICPGVLIRKVSLTAKRTNAPVSKEPVSKEASAAKEDAVEEPRQDDPIAKQPHSVHELAAFASDDTPTPPLSYDEFTHGDMQVRLAKYRKPVYTQVFHGRDASQSDISVQFICSASVRDDVVSAVHWRHTPKGQTREPVAFAIASRLFCSPQYSEADETFSVGALLQPLAELHTCIKRNEGWWTYEFCFGYGIQQYHRENDGKVTAEFSLGAFDATANAELEARGASLVTEHLDATHDSARPAFIEMYTGGTHCKEFDVSTPRRSRVYYYCSLGSANHHIVSVKETQTCTYTIKISSPVVCDHPHFITEDPKTEDKAEVVHCIPVATPGNEEASQSTRSPAAAAPTDAFREVEVAAT